MRGPRSASGIAERLVLAGIPPGGHAQDHAAAGEVMQALDLARQRHRVMVGEHEDAGGEPDAAGHGRDMERQRSGDIQTAP